MDVSNDSFFIRNINYDTGIRNILIQIDMQTNQMNSMKLFVTLSISNGTTHKIFMHRWKNQVFVSCAIGFLFVSFLLFISLQPHSQITQINAHELKHLQFHE